MESALEEGQVEEFVNQLEVLLSDIPYQYAVYCLTSIANGAH